MENEIVSIGEQLEIDLNPRFVVTIAGHVLGSCSYMVAEANRLRYFGFVSLEGVGGDHHELDFDIARGVLRLVVWGGDGPAEFRDFAALSLSPIA